MNRLFNSIVVFAAFLLFMLGCYRLIERTAGSLESGASHVVYPLLKVSQALSGFGRNLYQSHEQLVRKLQEQQALIDQLRAEIIELAGTASFVEHSNDATAFAHRYKTDTALLAHVMVKCFDPNEHSYLIDVGSRQGVEKDMVAVYQSALVGKVVQVYPWYSKVILVTDKSCKVAAFCVNSGVQGIHEGMNDQEKTALQFVHHLQTPQQGDLVLSSGEGLIFPKGFGLGTISAITQQDFQYAIFLKPCIDVTQIDYCYVIQKGAELLDSAPVQNSVV